MDKFEIKGIPVISHSYGDGGEVQIGTADFVDDRVQITLRGETIDVLQTYVRSGAEIRAFHINVELLAARKKED